MAANKLIIEGSANSGKTTLLKTLGEDAVIISYDDKPYPFKQYHKNIIDFKDIIDFLTQTDETIGKYQTLKKVLPKYVVFDSVSTLGNSIESKIKDRVQDGFKAWDTINKEITTFVRYVNDLVSEHKISVILTSHVVWDEKTSKVKELAKGSFGQKGGFLSTVDYAIYTERIGNKIVIHHKNKDMARSLLEDITDKQDSDSFSLKDYMTLIEKQQSNVDSFKL